MGKYTFNSRKMIIWALIFCEYLYIFIKIYLFPIAEGIVSYSIPKGMQRGMDIDLSDKTYDGYEEGDHYVNGLGQLVDGQRGKDNFRADINGLGKGTIVEAF